MNITVLLLCLLFSNLKAQKSVYNGHEDVCITTGDVPVTCLPNFHIVLDTVIVYPPINCPGTSCCTGTDTTSALGIIDLPTYNKDNQQKLNLAIKTCRFEDSCTLPFFLKFEGNKVGTLSYSYRCFLEVLAPCITKVASGTSVPVYYDGSKSLTSSCTCRVTSASRGISLHILYMKTMDCSIKVHDGNCEWFLPCNGTSGFSEGVIMMFDGREIRVSFDSSEALAVEIKGTDGIPVDVSCGEAVATQTLSPCALQIDSTTETSTLQHTDKLFSLTKELTTVDTLSVLPSRASIASVSKAKSVSTSIKPEPLEGDVSPSTIVGIVCGVLCALALVFGVSLCCIFNKTCRNTFCQMRPQVGPEKNRMFKLPDLH